jgi:hypothetical protein
MGGLLTVQQFLDRFPQVDIVNHSSFHNAWVTGTSIEPQGRINAWEWYWRMQGPD